MTKSKFFYLWLNIGVKAKWVSWPYCMTHDGNYEYMTEEEKEEWDEGGDPCHVSISVFAE